MSRSKASMFAVLLVGTLITLPELASSQQPTPQILSVPIPPTSTTYCCVYNVLCVGADLYVPVKATSSISQDDACQQAINYANSLCPNGISDMALLNVTQRVCKLIPTGGGSGIAAASASQFAAPIQSPAWQIIGTLRYCDGTPGVQSPFEGETYCQTLKDAKDVLCEIKKATNPCKSAYMTFCIVRRPCQ